MTKDECLILMAGYLNQLEMLEVMVGRLTTDYNIIYGIIERAVIVPNEDCLEEEDDGDIPSET